MTRRAPNWVGNRTGDRSPPPRARRASDEWADTGPIGASTRTQATLSRTLTYGLWTAIGLALVLGLINCAGTPAAAPGLGATTPPEPVPPPGGCAELTVAAWLANDTDLLAGVGGLSRAQPEPGRRQADRTFAVSVTPGADPDSWVFVVGAQVRERDPQDEQWRSAGTQFFTVTLVPADGGCGDWGPATLPARVVAPALGGAVDAPYDVRLAHTNTPLSDTVQAFFAALLTGAGSLERYVAPGVTIAPFVPPPYAQVELAELRAHRDSPVDRSGQPPADGTVARLLATVATDAQGADLPLVYPVLVGVRGGRWEVIATDPAVEIETSTATPSTSP